LPKPRTPINHQPTRPRRTRCASARTAGADKNPTPTTAPEPVFSFCPQACRARQCTGSASPRSLTRPSQHQPPLKTRKQQPPSTQTIPVQPPRRAVRGSARAQPPHGHSPGPVSTSPGSKPPSTIHPQHFLVFRQHQNPCTPAHGSPKTKPGILFSPTGCTLVFRQHQRPGRSRTRLTKTKKLSRPSRLRGEKFTSNLSHYAPTHRNFHAKFFQKFLPTAL